MFSNKNQDPFAIGEVDRVATVKGRQWSPDSFLNLSKKKGKEEEFLGTSISGRIIKIVFLIIILILSLLFLRTFYLQIIKGQEYYSFAEGNRIRIKTIPVGRGIIFDRNCNPLVENVGSFNLIIIPADLPRSDEEKNLVLDHVAKEFNINREYLDQLLLDVPFFSCQPILIKENISRDEALKILVNSDKFSGITAESGIRRKYILDGQEPGNSSFSHILGYEGKISPEELKLYPDRNYLLTDRIGKSGIEFFYENLLRGIHGEKKVEVDSQGRELKILAEVKSSPGKNIKLTIDQNLQKKSEEILSKYLKTSGKKKGVVIISNPQNGEILTLVSLPVFDNNDFSTGINQKKYSSLINDKAMPLFNRAITGEYPSGSTFKPVVALAALEEGIIDRHTTFLSTGGIWVYQQWFFPDWKAGGHGLTNVTRALAESINTFFYIIGGGYEDFEGLGVKKIVEYAQKFNLGKTMGIDLPSESAGFLPTPEWKKDAKNELWYIGDTYHLAIGQGDILVTPLQINFWTTVFANSSTLYQPHLLKEILDKENKVVETKEPKILKDNIAHKQNIDIVRTGLRQAVVSGSARRLLDLPVAVAGKTGTAQWHSQKSPHSWFTGFAPYENPEIAITVLVEEGGEGSGIALSIAHDILMWYFSTE